MSLTSLISQHHSADAEPCVPIVRAKKYLVNNPWLTGLHLICIGVFAAFLCWGQTGGAPINGDDMGILHRIMLEPINYQYDYLHWTQWRLHVVGLLYGEFKVAGSSLEVANLIWLGIYITSAFAGYAYLRKVFNPTVAMTGGIFYLCYSSKYEPLTWWSAGAYTVVWLAFFGLLYALESKLSYRAKTLVVAGIIALSMYIYEVFIVLVPFISLILLTRRKREVSRLRKSDWLLASLPIVVVIIHVCTLASLPKPIFHVSKAALGNATLSERVATGFTSAIDATIGPKHNKTVKQALHVYRDYFSKEDQALTMLLWGGIVLFAIAVLAGVRTSIASAPSLVTVNETAFLGFIALFVSAFIGFVSNYCLTPSRLTGIPSIGLMLLVCAALEWIYMLSRRAGGWRKVSLLVVASLLPFIALVTSVREVQAFHSLLKQAGEVDKFDLDLAKRIKTLHPVARKGDEIYVRMPRATSEVIGRWQNFWSGFNTGRAFETFWYLYDVYRGFEFSNTHYISPGEDSGMQTIAERWSKKGTTQVYPFFVDEHQNVTPISTIILTDIHGHELKTLDFSSQFSDYKGKFAAPQYIPITASTAPKFLH